MRITLPRVRCLDDATPNMEKSARRGHVFVFAPSRYGPKQIGIVFGRDDHWGRPLTKTMIVDLEYQPADRVLERGELLIVTADNLRLLHFIEASGMFRRAGLTDTEKAEAR
jgi:hypothetical protein